VLFDDPAVPSLILIEDNTVTLPARQLRKDSLATLNRCPQRVVAVGLGLNPFQQGTHLGGKGDAGYPANNDELELIHKMAACAAPSGKLALPNRRRLSLSRSAS